MANNGGYLTRDAILFADDIESIDVSVPEWGGVIRLRMMTALEREGYEMALSEAQKNNGGIVINIRASLVAWCAIDAEGKRLFSREDVVLLGDKSAAALSRVFEAARKLNAILGDEQAEIKKSSESTSKGDSVLD